MKNFVTGKGREKDKKKRGKSGSKFKKTTQLKMATLWGNRNRFRRGISNFDWGGQGVGGRQSVNRAVKRALYYFFQNRK